MAIGTGHRSNNYSESKRNDHLDNNRRQEQRNEGIPNKSHPNFREEHKSFSSIFISNIPWNASVQDLWDICNKWGVEDGRSEQPKREKSKPLVREACFRYQRYVIEIYIQRSSSKIKISYKIVKDSSCSKKVKLAFENADFKFESRVDNLKDKNMLTRSSSTFIKNSHWYQKPIKTPLKRNRNVNDVYEQEFEQCIMTRTEKRLEQFVDQLADQMNDTMNLRRRGDRNGKRIRTYYLGYRGWGRGKNNHVLCWVQKNNRCQFMIAILKMSLRRKNDLLFGEEEDNIEDVVVVANDICSSMIKTTLSVDFSKTVDSNPHELIWLQKGNLVECGGVVNPKNKTHSGVFRDVHVFEGSQRNEAIPLSDEEIALDANASSEGTLSPGGPQYDYMMSSEAEDDY
nr:reverse transcriptase domain-containing protein [Tanacetum cinerariifolium]